jgi:hypothetical protein
MDVEMGPIKAGDKGILTGWIPATVKEEGKYTIIIRVHRLGEKEVFGEAKKEILITKEKYGCRKGRCVDVPNEWWGECIIEKCSCMNCYDISECWNAWTGKNCKKGEPCREFYGTNYREWTESYVFKIDPTKTDRYSCLGIKEIEYQTFRDGKFSVDFPKDWEKIETGGPSEIAAFSSENLLEIISREDKISLQSYKENFEKTHPGKLLESEIADNRYHSLCEYEVEGVNYRLWLVATNCGDYTYIVQFLYLGAKEATPEGYLKIRDHKKGFDLLSLLLGSIFY